MWFVQRDIAPTWEFVALTSMAEGMSRPILALGLAFAGCHIARWQSVWLRWVLSVLAIGMGMAALGGGSLIALDYLALAASMNGPQVEAMRSVAMKGIALAGMAGVLLLPLGVYGLLVIKQKAKDDTNL